MRKLSWTMQDIIDILKNAAPRYLGPSEITDALAPKYKYNNVCQTLGRMEQRGLVIHDAAGAWKFGSMGKARTV